MIGHQNMMSIVTTTIYALGIASAVACCIQYDDGKCRVVSTSGLTQIINCGPGTVCCLALSNAGDGSVGAIGCCPASEECSFFSTQDGQVHAGCGEDPAQLGD